MRGFLLARIAGVGGESVIKGGAVDILRVLGQMMAHGWRKIGVYVVRHGFYEVVGASRAHPRPCSATTDSGSAPLSASPAL